MWFMTVAWLKGGNCLGLECPTSEMIADALTKPLTYDEFRKYRDVMVQDVHTGLPS